MTKNTNAKDRHEGSALDRRFNSQHANSEDWRIAVEIMATWLAHGRLPTAARFAGFRTRCSAWPRQMFGSDLPPPTLKTPKRPQAIRIDPEIARMRKRLARTRMFNRLVTQFNREELIELVFLMGLDAEDILRPTLRGSVISLIEFCERRTLIEALARRVSHLRPRPH